MTTSLVDRIAGGGTGAASIPLSLTTTTGATTTEGILLGATNSATSGAQVFSPSLHFQGSGWKTNATAAAQSCDWMFEVEPVQGAAAPDNYLAILQRVDTAAYAVGWKFSNENSVSNFYIGAVKIRDEGSGQMKILSGATTLGYFSSTSFQSPFPVCLGSGTLATDNGLSRISAGLIGVGTGGAGSFAGALKATRLITDPLTFATLPASPSSGARCMITDATSTVFATLAATGGANVMPVFYDGTNWRIG